MIEAELKCDVHDPDQVAGILREWADEDTVIYRDTYYEVPAGGLHARGLQRARGLHALGRELRLRTISGASTRHVLTYKEAPVDQESQSKPEFETEVADRSVVAHIFAGLGLVEDIAFEKHCRNYRFDRAGRDFLATLVQVPEIDNSTFIEIETMVPAADDVPAALDAINAVFVELGIDPVADRNSSYYQQMVSEHRQQHS